MAIRVLSVEVKQIGESKEEDCAARTRLKDLCEMVQQATNYVWMEWFAWHHANGSAARIQEWQKTWCDYKENGGTKPVLDLKAVSNTLSNKMYHGVTERWPDLHSRVVVLMLNRLTSLIGAKKAAKGSFAGWHSILLFREAVPSSIHPLPIPFDTPKAFSKSSNGNAKLLLPETSDGSHRLVLSLAREAVKGKAVKASVKFDCTIWDKGRQMAGRRQVLTKIARGEYQMKGSQLCFSRGKIFANVTYEIPEQATKRGDGIAFLMASRFRPLVMKFADGSRLKWVGGDGRVVSEKRRRLMHQRMSRKTSFRQCPTTNSKGHGRNRSLAKTQLLSRGWRDFVTTFSRNMAAAVASECVRRGVGVLYLGRPKKDSRFLSTAGNDSRFDSTSWDWYGLEKKIVDKCAEHGIAVIVRPEKPPFVAGEGKKPNRKPNRNTRKAAG